MPRADGFVLVIYHAKMLLRIPVPATNLWPEETLAPGENFTVTLTAAGQYPYVCTLHDGMTGLVTVP